MSTISIQFGQCGNQIGHAMLSCIWKDNSSVSPRNTLDDDYTTESIDRWFSSDPNQEALFARALMVDTERKVVDSIYGQQVNSVHSWKYKKRNIVTQLGGGAGNNWAYGYAKKGMELQESVLDAVRMESEQSDRVTSILSILSSAGGTGSGVGSFITERLRDEFSTKLFLSAVVLPYQSGEVATQNYNTLLTLAKLYDVSDMITIFENDQLHQMSTKLLNIKDVDISHLNDLISIKMASFLQPTNCPTQNISTITNHLTPHPAYKLVTLKTMPHIATESVKYGSDYTWDTLVRHIKQTLRVNVYGSNTRTDWEMKPPEVALHYNSLMQYACCVSNALFTRGKYSADLKKSVQDMKEARLYPKWLPQDSQLLHAHQCRRFLAGNSGNFITLATNNHFMYYPLDEITKKAWNTFKYKAYLHQYAQHGVTEDEFFEAFTKVESTIMSYQNLCKQ